MTETPFVPYKATFWDWGWGWGREDVLSSGSPVRPSAQPLYHSECVAMSETLTLSSLTPVSLPVFTEHTPKSHHHSPPYSDHCWCCFIIQASSPARRQVGYLKNSLGCLKKNNLFEDSLMTHSSLPLTPCPQTKTFPLPKAQPTYSWRSGLQDLHLNYQHRHHRARLRKAMFILWPSLHTCPSSHLPFQHMVAL